MPSTALFARNDIVDVLRAVDGFELASNSGHHQVFCKHPSDEMPAAGIAACNVLKGPITDSQSGGFYLLGRLGACEKERGEKQDDACGAQTSLRENVAIVNRGIGPYLATSCRRKCFSCPRHCSPDSFISSTCTIIAEQNAFASPSKICISTQGHFYCP